MRTYEQMQQEFAKMMRDLREREGLSVFAMANKVGVSDKTWKRYEEGTSAPDIVMFTHIFSVCSRDAMRTALDYMYPEIYKDIDSKSGKEDFRTAAIHYIDHVASDHQIREICYLVFGKHGSNFHAQLEEFNMIDHLPMEYRYMIANMVMQLWTIAEAKGTLVCTDSIMPELGAFADGLKMGMKATYKGVNSYTTMLE